MSKRMKFLFLVSVLSLGAIASYQSSFGNQPLLKSKQANQSEAVKPCDGDTCPDPDKSTATAHWNEQKCICHWPAGGTGGQYGTTQDCIDSPTSCFMYGGPTMPDMCSLAVEKAKADFPECEGNCFSEEFGYEYPCDLTAWNETVYPSQTGRSCTAVISPTCGCDT